MPVNIKQFDEQEGYGNQNQNENFGGGSNNTEDVFIDAGGGGGGGGSSSGGSSTVSVKTTPNLFIFNIKCNVPNFSTSVNGKTTADSKRITITKESLLTENKKITISKNGYRGSEYFIVEMVNDGIPVIKNNLISEKILGIDTKDIVLTKYNFNEVEGLPVSILQKSSNDLIFTLTKSGGDEYEEPKSYSVTFLISGTGSPISVVKNANKKVEFFPEVGKSLYEDTEGTFYKIKSSDLSLYRLKTVVISTDNNQPKELNAEDGESLDIQLELTQNYTIDLITEEIFQGNDGLDPQISLVKTDPREYNINDKVGVPIMIRKNSDVQAITVIVGDDIHEFDNLDDADVIGITIPHESFSKIGKYNVKLYPFSFEDYENQVRPPEEAEVVIPKEVVPKTNITEKLELPQIKFDDKYNKYKPISLKSSGGYRGIPNPFGRFTDFENRIDFESKQINYNNRQEFL